MRTSWLSEKNELVGGDALTNESALCDDPRASRPQLRPPRDEQRQISDCPRLHRGSN